jgi:hypothetical protein
MNRLDPHFGEYTGAATSDLDNSISVIRKEVRALFWSSKILEQMKDPSSSMQRTDLRGLAEQMHETADTLVRVVERAEQRVGLSDFWTE